MAEYADLGRSQELSALSGYTETPSIAALTATARDAEEKYHDVLSYMQKEHF